MAIQSPLNVRNISQNVRSLGIAVTRVKKSAFTSSKILMNRTKVKRASLFQGRRLFERKKESIRIKNQENIIEASKLTAPIKRGAAAIARSTQGFLGRILDFTATLLTGWLLYNLPTLIAMAKELMGRITRMVDLLKGFVSNLGNIMGGFGNVLKASAQNIMSFDFTDNSKRVDKAMKDLNASFEDMGAQIDEGLELLTTPLSEGLTTGENAPEFGTRFPAQPEGGAQPSGPSRLQPIHKQALDIISGPESGGNYNAMNNGRAGDRPGGSKKWIGKNLTDMTIGEIKYHQNVRKDLWAAGRYQIIPISLPTAQSAAGLKDNEMFDQNNQDLLAIGLLKVQGPNAWAKYSKYSKRQIEIMYEAKNTPLSASTTQTPATSTPTPATPSIPQSPVKPVTPILTSRMGEMRGNRRHGGTDLATNSGTPLRAVSDGMIVDSGVNPGGWGNFIVIKDDQNIYHLYGHIQDGYKKGGSVKKGEVVAKVGTTGRVTGPHLHWETGTGWNGYVLSGKFDPLNRYSKFAPFNTNSTVSPAQITPQQSQGRQQLPGQLTPERRGQEIVLIDDVQPQQPAMPMGGGGGGGIIPIIINPLNSYIKNKLLLDLAYT